MKFFLVTVSAMAVIVSLTSLHPRNKWKKLLDKDLSQWEMYLSFRHQDGYAGEAPKNEKGELVQPVGYNKNVNNVFTVTEENGEPVLKVSGEYYGCVFTKQEFENYHLKLQVKWGNKKWVPRLNEPMDAGLLYHSQGKCGVDYWRTWMLAQELQIMEKSFGDYWNIANSQIEIKAVKQANGNYIFDRKSSFVLMGEGTPIKGYCQRSEDVEKPMGEWNTVELICFGDKSIHIINGHVVMALRNSAYFDGKESRPLIKGKIQLQSEAAEVYYKDIQIKPIKKIPSQYAALFD